MKLILIAFSILFSCSCVEDRKYVDSMGRLRSDPQEVELMNSAYMAIDSFVYWKSKRTAIETDYSNKSKILNEQIVSYNISCQKFISLLYDNILKLYSNLIDAEKSQNVPKIELNKRQFYKSLTSKQIQGLNQLSDQLQEINVKAVELQECEKELDKSKEKLLEASNKVDKFEQYFSARSNNMRLSQSYNQNQISNYLKDWEQSIKQRNIEYNQNYNMMRMNNSLSDIANSLKNIQK